MTSTKIVAVFDSQDAARNARDRLLGLGLPRESITITDQSSSERTVQTSEARGSFWAHIKQMFMPDRDRYALDESIRRGGCAVVATVDDDRTDEAISLLESAGAIDLDERQAQWRASGWTGPPAESDLAAQPDVAEEREPRARARTPSEFASGDSSSATRETARPDDSTKIPVVEERLRVGKREVNRGSVRVRSYIVEEPVHEEVRLREERVQVERRPVDTPARPVGKGSPDDAMREQTVEVSETAEEAVVGKEARVTEEVVVSKTADERVEQIDDKVRRTKVEVEDGRTGERAPQSARPAKDAPRPGRT